LNQVEAIRWYTDSRKLAATIGHIDCYLWAALGLADSLFLVGELDEADQVLARLKEHAETSVQRYPIEELHISFSRAVLASSRGIEIEAELDALVEAYLRLGVQWPRRFLEHVRKGDYALPKPF
jgi:hypothetical protein